MAEADFFAGLLEKHFESVETDVANLSAGAVTSAFTEPPLTTPLAIEPAVLGALLRPSLFDLESRCDLAQTLVFARPSFAKGLFESITIQAAGTRSHVLQVRVGVWFGRHGIVTGQSRQLREIAPQSVTGILLLKTPADARAAEKKIAELAPPAAFAFARLHGSTLLSRVADFQSAASRYLARLRPVSDPARVIARLLAEATTDQIAFARRLLETPGIQRIKAPEHYLAAALGLAVLGQSVEGLGLAELARNGAGMKIQLIVHSMMEESAAPILTN